MINYSWIVIICSLLCFSAAAQTENKGSIYLSTDQGERWHRTDDGFPSEARVNNWVVKNNTVITATEEHGIYISNNRLKSWQSSSKGLPSGVKINALKVFGNTVFAGTYRDGIFRSDNNGETWQAFNQGLGNFSVRCFHVSNTIVLAGTDRGIYASNTGEKSWTLIKGGMQINTFTATEEYLYAATHLGVLRSADEGKTWTDVWNDGALFDLTGNKNEITGITLDGYVITSQDYGKTWVMWKDFLPMLYSKYIFQLTPASPMILFAPWKNIFRSYILLPGFVPQGLPQASPFGKLLSTPFGVLAAVSPRGC